MNRPSKYDTIHAINHLIENFNEQSNDNSVIVEIWDGEECIKSDLDMAIAPYESALHLVTHPNASLWMEIEGHEWVDVPLVDAAKANRKAMRTLYETGILPESKALSLPTKKRMYRFLRECGWTNNRGPAWYHPRSKGKRFTVSAAFEYETERRSSL